MRAAIIDIDGTLVDTNYQHALAWYRAFRLHGIVLPVWRIHRSIGMGGDQLVPALVGEEVDEKHGDEIRDAREPFYKELLGEVEPLHGAHELIVDLKERGLRVVLASSSPEDELEHYLELLDACDLADAWTTKEDVESTKPAPDLLWAALQKIGEPADAPSVVIGDSVYDVAAAKNAGMPAVVVRSGGFGDDELRTAGALAIYDTPGDLAAALDEIDLS